MDQQKIVGAEGERWSLQQARLTGRTVREDREASNRIKREKSTDKKTGKDREKKITKKNKNKPGFRKRNKQVQDRWVDKTTKRKNIEQKGKKIFIGNKNRKKANIKPKTEKKFVKKMKTRKGKKTNIPKKYREIITRKQNIR